MDSSSSLSDPEHQLLLSTQFSHSQESVPHPYLAANNGRQCHAWKGIEAEVQGPGGR